MRSHSPPSHSPANSLLPDPRRKRIGNHEDEFEVESLNIGYYIQKIDDKNDPILGTYR